MPHPHVIIIILLRVYFKYFTKIIYFLANNIDFICVFCIITCSSCSCKKEENLIVYRNFYDQDVTSFNYLSTNKYQDMTRIANLIDGLVENDKYGNIVMPAEGYDADDNTTDGVINIRHNSVAPIGGYKIHYSDLERSENNTYTAKLVALFKGVSGINKDKDFESVPV